jgi:hypothetical protein
VSSFRETAIESGVIAVTFDHGAPLERHAIESKVQAVLQFPDGHRERITAVIDRMIQERKVLGPAGSLILSPELSEATTTMRKISDVQWFDLRDGVEQLLKKSAALKSVPSEVVNTIMESLGAVLVESAHAAKADLEGDRNRSILDENIKSRLRQLHSYLDALGIPDGEARIELGADTLISRLDFFSSQVGGPSGSDKGLVEKSIWRHFLRDRGEKILYCIIQKPIQKGGCNARREFRLSSNG